MFFMTFFKQNIEMSTKEGGYFDNFQKSWLV
jgi:hypothetical protein